MCTKNLSFCENSKKKFGEGGGSGWGGTRVDVIEELKFSENSHKNFFFLGGGGGGGPVGGGGQGGCERRIKVFVKI